MSQTLPDYLAELNPSQLQAAQTLSGPVLIQAGAGSGKTKTVIARIRNLIDHGVNPANILAITFTNKAANELRDRLPKNAVGVHASTIHSLCVTILRHYPHLDNYTSNFTILDTDDVRRIARMALNDYEDANDIPARSLKGLKPRVIASCFSHVKNAKNIEQAVTRYARTNNLEPFTDALIETTKFYQDYVTRHNAMDFDDLLYNAVKLLKSNKQDLAAVQDTYRYISVDEYQDTSAIQEELINLLSDTPEENLCVVGDPNQSIYAFRGAEVTNILNFKKKHPRAKVLSIMYNYRSTQSILDAANDVISNNPQNFVDTEDKLTAVKAQGQKPIVRQYARDYDEANDISKQIKHFIDQGAKPNEIAVLYRMNSLTRKMESSLMTQGIPYQIVGSLSFYERAEIKDILAYLRLITNHTDDLAFQRIINTPSRHIGTTTLDLLDTWAKWWRQQDKACSLYDVAANSANITQANGRHLPKSKQDVLTNFVNYIASFDITRTDKNVLDVIKALLHNGYMKYAMEMDSKEPDRGTSRVDNLNELVNAASEFVKQNPAMNLAQSILAFIESATLGTREAKQANPDQQVQLMTVHAAKGLEFKYVFVIGCENDVFPSGHVMMQKDPVLRDKAMHEERRLMYVAITRAKDFLQLSYANQRLVFGQLRPSKQSMFLAEIKSDHKTFVPADD